MASAIRPTPKAPAIALGLLLIVAASAPGDASRALRGRVVGVSDGDSLTLLLEGGEQKTRLRIRLAQIDAPESGQPWGRNAKRALSALAFGKTAAVQVIDRDRFGRSIAEVWVDEVHLNRAMVRDGHAWAYTAHVESVEIIALEDEARAAKRGLWALPEAERDAPWIWRRSQRDARERKGAARPPECVGAPRCSELETCAEARFQLEHCGLARLDEDGDGIPCEQLCR